MGSISDLRKKRNQVKIQLQKIALMEGQDWRNAIREAKPVRQKFLQQWKRYNNGKSNSFFAIADQYAIVVLKETKARKTLDAKFKPYLNQIMDLDCKIKKAKDKKKKLRSHHT